MAEWTWRTLQQMAVQESRALREFAKVGRDPKCARMKWPWEDGYIDISERLTADEKAAEPHGTNDRYQWHLRERIPPCDACRAAHARYMKEARAEAKVR